jgi:FkbM family methyltransferase
MLSYAQNFEDVMLHRALQDVRAGTYVDVGAWHPELHSVTKWFYDNGWSGVNVEPSRLFTRLLRWRRRRDLNLNIALGSASAELLFHEIGWSGLSSLRAESVQLGERIGFRESRSYPVQVRTMAQVFEEYLQGREVHFVKIDVEGFETEVLAGFDWSRNRPWIVVVEATRPCSPDGAWHEWEPTILAADYQLAWFDGLNRFYVAREQSRLLQHFQVPPNVFDEFRIPRLHKVWSHAEVRLLGLLA